MKMAFKMPKQGSNWLRKFAIIKHLTNRDKMPTSALFIRRAGPTWDYKNNFAEGYGPVYLIFAFPRRTSPRGWFQRK